MQGCIAIGHLPETKKKMDLLDQKEQFPFFFILNTYFYHYFLRERNLKTVKTYTVHPVIIFQIVWDKFLSFFLSFHKKILRRRKRRNGVEERSTFDSISRKRTPRFENEFELGNDRHRGDWPAVHPVRLYSCKLRIRTESARPTLETRRGQKLRFGWRRTSEAMKRSCYHLVTSVGRSHQHERRGTAERECVRVCVYVRAWCVQASPWRRLV